MLLTDPAVAGLSLDIDVRPGLAACMMYKQILSVPLHTYTSTRSRLKVDDPHGHHPRKHIHSQCNKRIFDFQGDHRL